MRAEEYKQMTKRAVRKSRLWVDCGKAFAVGGLICVLGQALGDFYGLWVQDKQTASGLVSVTLVFLSALFTGLGLYQKLARHAGAGTLVPITGFANAMVAPALEFKAEGFVLGTGVKLFTIAGPVLVYGTTASVVYGVIYAAIRMFGWVS